jgi:hypothetical protein
MPGDYGYCSHCIEYALHNARKLRGYDEAQWFLYRYSFYLATSRVASWPASKPAPKGRR